MAEPYIGEIRIFAGNFAPSGWAICNGALIPIAQNDTLFILLGTTYGGDGVTTFALPDLRGRAPIHAGTGGGSTYVIGEMSGVETVNLTTNQLPVHTHDAQGQSASGTQAGPGNGVWAASSLVQYSPNAPNAVMNPASVGTTGQSQPHDNMMPFLTLNFIISLFGVFPSQT